MGARAEIATDGSGDMHYATRPFSENFGHRFYNSLSNVLQECFRITSAGINGLAKRAMNFADPVAAQDLATKNYVDTRPHYTQLSGRFEIDATNDWACWSDPNFGPSLQDWDLDLGNNAVPNICLLYTSPSPRDRQKSRMPSSA